MEMRVVNIFNLGYGYIALELLQVASFVEFAGGCGQFQNHGRMSA
jgi:hypothetical protein